MRAYLERRRGGGHDLVEPFPGVLFGRAEGREQVVQAEQRQQQQGGPERLQQCTGRRAVGQVRRAGLQFDPQHSNDVAQEHQVQRHRHAHRHYQHLRER